MKKRIISLTLSIFLILSLFPAMSGAFGENIVITTQSEWDSFVSSVNSGKNPYIYMNGSVTLKTDVTATVPVGTNGTQFVGTFDAASAPLPFPAAI